MLVNPLTYGDLPATGGGVHSVGEIWAATLWDMYWNLVDAHGFSPDFYNGTGGNNLAMQLVMDGLKLQPCSPTFLDARDAILKADWVNNSGANQCLIWEAFARRGMGVNAGDGGGDASLTVIENFRQPTQCLDELDITQSASAASITTGGVITYTLVASNFTSQTLTSVLITDTVPANASYVAGSASHNGIESGGVVRWDVGQMGLDTTVTRTFQVAASEPPSPLFVDNMESGSGKWTVAHSEGTEDWALNGDKPHSGSTAWFAADADTPIDQYLVTANPVLLPAHSVLSFWHYYDTKKGSMAGVV
jgi:uncharacterized repeat protein (TIGR01451 family)